MQMAFEVSHYMPGLPYQKLEQSRLSHKETSRGRTHTARMAFIQPLHYELGTIPKKQKKKKQHPEAIISTPSTDISTSYSFPSQISTSSQDEQSLPTADMVLVSRLILVRCKTWDMAPLCDAYIGTFQQIAAQSACIQPIPVIQTHEPNERKIIPRAQLEPNFTTGRWTKYLQHHYK
jgi:hypothetical protein